MSYKMHQRIADVPSFVHTHNHNFKQYLHVAFVTDGRGPL